MTRRQLARERRAHNRDRRWWRLISRLEWPQWKEYKATSVWYHGYVQRRYASPCE